MICLACDQDIRGTVYSYGTSSPLCRKCGLELEALGEMQLEADRKAVEKARRRTARYAQPKPPLWLVGSVAGRITKGSPMAQRIIVALVYAIGAAGPVLTAAFADGAISGQEWGGIISAAFVAFWGKFSSSTTLFSATRPGETQASKPGVTL